MGRGGRGPQLPKALQNEMIESGAAHSLKSFKGRRPPKSSNKKEDRKEKKKPTAQSNTRKPEAEKKKPVSKQAESSSSPSTKQKEKKQEKQPAKRKHVEAEPDEVEDEAPAAKKPKTALEKLVDAQNFSSKSNKRSKKAGRKPASAAEAQEDLEIAWLEAQLGKGGSSSQGGTGDEGDDGLGDLLGDLDHVEASLGWRSDVSEGDMSRDVEEEEEDEDDVEEDVDNDDEELSSEDDEDEEFGSEDDDEDEEVFDGIDPSDTSSTEDASEAEEAAVTQHEASDVPPPAAIDDQPEFKPAKAAYVPPHLRHKETPTATEPPVKPTAPAEVPDDPRLDRQISSQLNKLSPQNLAPIQSSLAALYNDSGAFPRALVASSIVRLVLRRLDTRDAVGETQILSFAAVVAGLRTIREGCVAESLKRFDAQDEEGKEKTNIVRFWARLYNLGAISCVFVYGLIRELIGRLEEPDVEQLLVLLKTSGQHLRSDDSASLKEISQLVQERAEQISKEELSSRTKFMIETLTNLKNNKSSKSSASSDSSLQSTEEQFKKHLKAWTKSASGAALEPMSVGLDELRQADSRGKWWIVGNAWAGDPLAEQQKQSKMEVNKKHDGRDAEAKWLKLARKQGMNTNIRQIIFVALMGAEDYVDAVDRLLQLGLSGVQQREIVRVLLHCCGNEKAYNPFYTLTMQRLLTLTTSGKQQSHSFGITLQYSLWDLFKEMGEESVAGAERLKSGSQAGVGNKPLSERRARNLSLAFGWWFAKEGLALSVLKPLPFYTLRSHSRDFLVSMLRSTFHASQISSPLQQITSRPAKSAKKVNTEALEPVMLKVAHSPSVAQGLAHIIEQAFTESGDAVEEALAQSALETLQMGSGIVDDVDRLS